MRLLIALLVVAAAASAQPAPASDYADLLSTRFFPATGQFLFDSPGAEFILFPGQEPGYDIEGAAFIVRDDQNEVVGGQWIGSTGSTGSAAIQTLGTRGAPEWQRTLDDGGSYVLDLVWGGEVVGRVPFTASVEQSGDPYNPGQSYVLEGPWRTHAYFRHETDRPEYLMYLDAWIGPGEMESNAQTEVSIRRNGEEVAWGHGFSNMTHGWGLVDYRLHKPESRDPRGRFARAAPNPLPWTIQDVTPGTYEIVFSSETGPFRTMTIEGGDGTFVPHPRSALDYEPRAFFLGTRRMTDQNLRTSNSLYWIAPPVE
jgi:hypothetical protein